jgi:hypothetical protein
MIGFKNSSGPSVSVGRLIWMVGGGLAGIIFGIPGIIIGIALGYFLAELAAQLLNDRAVRAYFDNPGPSVFYEGEAGLAAFCALGVYLLSKSSPKVLTDEAAAARIAGGAASVFPAGKKIASLAESFSNQAFTRLKNLNPDLLSESLAARRAGLSDLPLLASELSTMAMGREAEQESRNVRQMLDPSYQPPLGENIAIEDPWQVLDIPRNASRDEVKSSFRKLALIYHPDNQTGMSEDEREKMAQAFMKIRDAYRVLMKEMRTTRK